MNKNLRFWQFCGFAITTFLGTLLHFVYDWFGNSLFFAPFSAVNESTWEHMKLLFFPTFLFAIFQSFYLKKDYPAFWKGKFWGILCGLLSIPILFYTFIGCVGNPPAWLNILFFFLSVGLSFVVEYLIFIHPNSTKKLNELHLTLLIILCLSFVIFTFFTPRLPLFKDPVTGGFGI